MKKRNAIIAAILAVAVVGGSIGGYYTFRSANRPVTMVYAVNELSGGYWGDNMNLDGMITSDASQNIYLSTEQKVNQVLVKEGDTVKEGDVLMTYDTTAKELELETMELDQKQNALKLDQAQEQLEQLKKTKPVSETPLQPTLEDPGLEDPFLPGFPGMEDPGMEDPGMDFPGMEDPGADVPGIDDPGMEDPGSDGPGEEVPGENPGSGQPGETPTPTPTPEPSYDDAVVYDGQDNPLGKDAEPYRGTGEKDDPLVFLCRPGTVITGEFFNRMAGFPESQAEGDSQEERKSFCFRLEIRDGDKASGELQTVWEQDGSLIQTPYDADYRTVFQMGSREDQRPEILFEKPLTSVTVTEGQAAELELQVKEQEGVSYRYQWFHRVVGEAEAADDNEQDKEQWTELTENEGQTNLRLEQAAEKDQGAYMVQVTAVNAYGSSKAVATCCVTVEQEPQEGTVSPSPTPTQAPVPSPEVTAAPTKTPTPAPTKTPSVSETPVPTETPSVSGTPAPTETPSVSETPVPTGKPSEADSSAETETPAQTAQPKETQTGSETEKPEKITSGVSDPNGDPAESRSESSDSNAASSDGSGNAEKSAAVEKTSGQKASAAVAVGERGRFQSSSGKLILVAGGGGTEADNGESVDPDSEVNVSGLQESYTKEELKQAIAEKEKEIRDLKLNQREAELRIQTAKKDLENQTVKATVSGVVKKVGDPENPSQDGSAFIQVDSQQGLYVKGYVSELMLDQLVPGTMVQISSWSSGAFATATVKEVSPYPAEEYASYGYGAQASYYPFIALIDDGADGFQNMESVSISMTVGADEASQNAIYLSKAFIREENGQKYVYVRGGDGTLERRPVKTGKILWGSEYEIKSGLTADDYIAFPYAKNELEGTKTEESTLSELYNY